MTNKVVTEYALYGLAGLGLGYMVPKYKTSQSRLGHYNPLQNMYVNDRFDTGDKGWSEFGSRGPGPYMGKDVENGNEIDVLILRNRYYYVSFTNESKRLTIMWRKFRWESWIKLDNYLGWDKFRLFRLGIDTQKGNAWPIDKIEYRRFYWITYLNHDDNSFINGWYHSGGNENFGLPFPGDNTQILKPNGWVYIRLDIDFVDNEYLEFQCNDRIWDLRGLKKTWVSQCDGERRRLTNLLHCGFAITTVDKNTDINGWTESTSIAKIYSTCISGEGQYDYENIIPYTRVC